MLTKRPTKLLLAIGIYGGPEVISVFRKQRSLFRDSSVIPDGNGHHQSENFIDLPIVQDFARFQIMNSLPVRHHHVPDRRVVLR